MSEQPSGIGMANGPATATFSVDAAAEVEGAVSVMLAPIGRPWIFVIPNSQAWDCVG